VSLASSKAKSLEDPFRVSVKSKFLEDPFFTPPKTSQSEDPFRVSVKSIPIDAFPSFKGESSEDPNGNSKSNEEENSSVIPKQNSRFEISVTSKQRPSLGVVNSVSGSDIRISVSSTPNLPLDPSKVKSSDNVIGISVQSKPLDHHSVASLDSAKLQKTTFTVSSTDRSSHQSADPFSPIVSNSLEPSNEQNASTNVFGSFSKSTDSNAFENPFKSQNPQKPDSDLFTTPPTTGKFQIKTVVPQDPFSDSSTIKSQQVPPLFSFDDFPSPAKTTIQSSLSLDDSLFGNNANATNQSGLSSKKEDISNIFNAPFSNFQSDLFGAPQPSKHESIRIPSNPFDSPSSSKVVEISNFFPSVAKNPDPALFLFHEN
jgi:hypothetical protein